MDASRLRRELLKRTTFSAIVSAEVYHTPSEMFQMLTHFGADEA